MDSQKRSNRRGLFFALGIAAGAVAGWYLNSDKGRRIRSESAKVIDELSDKAVENAHTILEKSRDYADELTSKFQKSAEEAEELNEDVLKMQN